MLVAAAPHYLLLHYRHCAGAVSGTEVMAPWCVVEFLD